MLAGAVLLAALLAAAISFGLAYIEAREFQDDMLRQVAAISAGPGPQAGSRAEPGVGDAESRLSVLHLPADPHPAWLPEGVTPGWHTLHSGGGEVRVYIAGRSPGGRTVVAQQTEVRNEIASDSALRTLIPFLLLMPVLGWLVVRIVRRELAPVIRLAHSLDAQPADRPDKLADDRIPAEIAPFVHAINRLLERVNTLMRQQRRFIADAAHELRSPLTAIQLQVWNVSNAGSAEAMRERLGPLRDGIERARRLTEQLLNLAKVQAGDSATTAVDLLALARELVAEFMPLAEHNKIDIGFDQVIPIFVLTSPDLLRQILRNALENALNYTPAGGQVSIRLSEQDGDGIIEVIDDGPGVPDAERERVFDSFYRLPGSRGQGSGIGLAIARASAVRLGGSISLHGRPGRDGLVFRYRQARKKMAP
jgi:two-component system OmpR family sensor kinase